jgi:hypothetical protein
MNKNLFLILILLFLLFSFKKNELFKPFNMKTKTTYTSIPKPCLIKTGLDKYNKNFVCDLKLCRDKVKPGKEFTFIKTPCSGKEMMMCKKCLLNNLNMTYDDAYSKCVTQKKCIDNSCKHGYHGLEGVFHNKKILKH